MSIFGKKVKLQVGQSFGVSAIALTENQFCNLLQSVENDINELNDYIKKEIDLDFSTQTQIVYNNATINNNVNFMKHRIAELQRNSHDYSVIAECNLIYQMLYEKAIQDFINIHGVVGSIDEDTIVSSTVEKLKRQVVKLNHPPRLNIDLGVEMFPELIDGDIGWQVQQTKELATKKRIKLTNSSEYETDHQLYDWSQRTKRG